jgi:tetratricopeptide (TPR) repeat protein
VNRVRGDVQLAYDQPDSAYQSYRKSIELVPNNPENLVYLSNFLWDNGLYEEGLTLTDQAITLDPLDISSLGTRAILLYDLGKMNKAKKAFEEILKMEPYNSFSLFQMGKIYVFENDLTKAEELYNVLSQIYSQDSTVFGNPATLLETFINAAKGDKIKALSAGDSPLVRLLLGEKEEAIKAIIEYQEFYRGPYFLERQIFDLVRDDPRFQELVARKRKEYALAKQKYGDLSFLEDS